MDDRDGDQHGGVQRVPRGTRGRSVRQNQPQLIPASTDPVLGGKYTFEDSDVAPGRTYYYELEDVEYSGATARHGPIVITASGGWGQIEWAMSIGVGALVLAWVLWRTRRSNSTGVRRINE